MKGNAFNIIVVIALGIVIYFLWTADQTTKELKSQLNSIEFKYDNKVDSLKLIISDLNDTIKKNEAIVQEIEKSEAAAKQTANQWKKSYNDLVKETPATLRDSLTNYMQRDVVSQKRIKNLEQALKFADSTKVIQYAIISDLKEVNTQKDVIIDAGVERLKSTVKAFEGENKKQRTKGRIEGGVGGILLTILIVILI